MLAWIRGVAAVGVAALVSASACAHDWDSLEANGETMASQAVIATCEDYCAAAECASNVPCQTACENDMADCSQGELEAIQGCIDPLVGQSCQSVCAGWSLTFETCLGVALLPESIDCWSSPISGC